MEVSLLPLPSSGGVVGCDGALENALPHLRGEEYPDGVHM